MSFFDAFYDHFKIKYEQDKYSIKFDNKKNDIINNENENIQYVSFNNNKTFKSIYWNFDRWFINFWYK